MTARAPDYLEPVTAWRTWIVGEGPEGPVLASVVRRAAWPARRPFAAECVDRGGRVHGAPAQNCGCGVHATRLAEDAAYYVDVPSRRGLRAAIGTVSLWGSVIEGPEGWRASHAYPSSLFLLLREDEPGAPAALERTAAGLERYGVPVKIIDCRARGAAEALGHAPRASARRPAPTSVSWTTLGLRRV